MSLIGMSNLELRQLIEQAFLPEPCVVQFVDAEHLTIELGEDPDDRLTVTGIHIHSLTTCHELHSLVQQLQEERRAGRRSVSMFHGRA